MSFQTEEPETITTPTDQELPKLYSKRLILGFSIFFSTIFAAALLIANLRKLEKQAAAAWVLLFAMGYLVATAVIMAVFNIAPQLSVVANVVGAAILNEFFWNKYLGSEIEFEKKSWVKPAIISVLIALCLFSFIFMRL